MKHHNRPTRGTDGAQCGTFVHRNKWYLLFIVVGLIVTVVNVAAYLHFATGSSEASGNIADDPQSFIDSHSKKKGPPSSAKVTAKQQDDGEKPPEPQETEKDANDVEPNEVGVKQHRHHNKEHKSHHGEVPPATKHHHRHDRHAQETEAPTRHHHHRHQQHHDKNDYGDEQIIDDEMPQKHNSHDRNELQNVHKVSLGDPQNKKVFGGQQEEQTAAHHRHHHRRQQEDEKKEVATEKHVSDKNHERHHRHHRKEGGDQGKSNEEGEVAVSQSSIRISEGASNNTLPRSFVKARYSYDDAVRIYHKHLKEKLSETLEQSSNKFSDIYEAEGHGVLLPTGTPEDLRLRFGVTEPPATENEPGVGKGNPFSLSDGDASLFDNPSRWAAGDSSADRAADEQDTNPDAAYCDPTNADYTMASDMACMRYLTDIRNMQSIKVMSSILSTGRTIKMKVYYRHNDVEAVLKVSQKKFALEPVSEVMAFHTDRVLGLRRVPPVVWTPFPIDFLRAAASQVSNFYSQWLQTFALDYETTKPLLSKCYTSDADDETINTTYPKHSGQCVNVSIQLWLFDVHDAEDTIVSPPRKYRHLLNLPSPGADNSALDDSDEGGRGKRRGKAFKPNEDEDIESSLRKDPNLRVAASELMDEFMFDYIIGNTDRWFGHNSFALGGAVHGKAPLIKTISTPRLAFIDQGSSFYGRSGPEMNPFTKNTGPFCRFKAATAQSVLNLLPAAAGNEGGKERKSSAFAKSSDAYPLLAKAVKNRLPKGIFHLSSHGLLKAAGIRADRIADHIRECLANFTRADVMYF